MVCSVGPPTLKAIGAGRPDQGTAGRRARRPSGHTRMSRPSEQAASGNPRAGRRSSSSTALRSLRGPTMERIAPIFAVRDLAVAMNFYERLGFAVRRYPVGGYGFASRRGIDIHLGVVRDGDRRISAAYLLLRCRPSGSRLGVGWGIRLSDALTRPTDRTDLPRSLHPGAPIRQPRSGRVLPRRADLRPLDCLP